MKKHKILIIKTGYSEILEDRNNSRKVSLGDILRTTPLLHLYKEDSVTWVADQEAFPLLEGNPLVDRILPYDLTTTLQLASEEFDTVINLEKIPGICALADKIRARRSRFGFTFNSQSGEAEAYDRATNVLSVSADPDLKRENTETVQRLLFNMVGEKWNGEEYVLGFKPTTSEVYDVALNTQIGLKWPTKAWPDRNWDELEERLGALGLKSTRQDKQEKSVLNDLNEYMNWLNSSRVIVSNDSLGLHLGIAMKKYTLGLFGPTPFREVHFYGRGKAIFPLGDYDCLPCAKGVCASGRYCIAEINPDRVVEDILKYTDQIKSTSSP